MTVADDLLEQLARLLGAERPLVRALHLPPCPWDGSKDGEFCALALESGALGLSYVLLDDTLRQLVGSPSSHAPLVGADALALAGRWRDGRGADRALGFAAVNALSRHLLDRAGLRPPDAADSIGGLAPQAGEHIGMVGYFPPLVRPVLAGGATLTVLELRAELAGPRDGCRITLDPKALRDCDQVLCTSTVLLNDTLDQVLEQCQRAKAVVMIGPGAGCLPDALFRRGVTALGGSWVEHPQAFAQALQAGAPWSAHARKTLWTVANYPGLPLAAGR